MYKNNSRNSSKFKGCSPLQLHRKLKGWSYATGYYTYVCREAVNGNKYLLHAVIEMVETSCKVEPPQALCRRSLQIT